MNKRRLIPASLLLFALAGVVIAGSASGSGSKKAQVLFDDFSYPSTTQFEENGWIARSKKGWPGVPDASWPPSSVRFVADPAKSTNQLLRLTATTEGKPENTTNAQICHERKYLYGTSAARVRFRDSPTSGPDGDQIVQTFYQLTPYEKPLDPKFSEADFEYLPNGGWGTGSMPILFTTTWEKVRIEPWLADNTSKWQQGSLDGWHTLVVQIDKQKKTVTYYLDGKLFSRHGGKFFPESRMSLNFNLWWIVDGMRATNTGKRVYEEDVDWVFHSAGKTLSPKQVSAEVAKLRKAKVAFRDTVPAGKPVLPSLCDL